MIEAKQCFFCKMWIEASKIETIRLYEFPSEIGKEQWCCKECGTKLDTGIPEGDD